ncbi:MAG: DUF4294 domain-containing protein [Lutibacter sp.]|jgi:hypothetical protein|nr:DUF4294 domain-containing protein [Lutibacter sp.]
MLPIHRIGIFFLFLGTAFTVFSQQKLVADSLGLSGRYIIFEGDTLLVELEEMMLLRKPTFKTSYDRRYYYWFRKKTLKAYPYARMAADRLAVINQRLENIQSKRRRKKYTRRLQKYLEGEFTDQLKKLTRTEGRILIKLIHRQTGQTTYELVKDLRTGWKAFWYQSTARLFKLSLKETYNPEQVREDFLIEDILQRAFVAGILEERPAKVPFDYLGLTRKYLEAPRPGDKK